ncbi:PREDICTED: putative late blight resistance protein homolog R1B-14 isoform X2 [Ipomoea nil]|uniref:putative late blight resistance protein homolog R1B-14 isoform X2 n=1 Tax=Ipomoea nil TaxID=35883 RepID=UPI000901CEA0|nr:PREDICTED: putative late blight resistance protein homolog R1B-14 isoform X2 [Ipomoea nil]
MAEVVVNLLVQNLTHLLIENVQLISGLEDEVQGVLTDLGNFKLFFREAGNVRYHNDILERLINKIRFVVSMAEDLIDQYVVAAKNHYDKKWLRCLDIEHKNRKRALDRTIQKVRIRLREIQDHPTYDLDLLRDDESLIWHNRAPIVEEDDVVGFDGEVDAIVQRLTGGSKGFEVISIVGMPGLGKTTLANKVFKDERVEYHFMIRAWIYVSQVYNRRDIFLRILKELSKRSYSYSDDVTDEDLVNEIKIFLGSTKYFIVIDDVWTVQNWDELKIAFPINKGSRVLVSTHHNIVAMHANSRGDPHNLKFLTEDESWELLQKKVFQEESSCPFELERPGRTIAKRCGGLPLAIVIIAGTLLGKPKTSRAWDKVADSISDFLRLSLQSYDYLMRMSYDQLPYDLKSCFLYFGAFPKGSEISAEKLVRLWIAEGFIIEEDAPSLTLEDIANGKLSDLVNRNLVMVMQRRSNGQIKSCRIHDMLHEFCMNEAKEVNLFEEMNMSRQLGTCRRVSVQSNLLAFLSSGLAAEHVRSLLCFSSNEHELPAVKLAIIREAFPLLRVLHTAPDESIIFTRFPRDMTKLFHLRYIAISTTLKILPQAIDSLWNMQTLIVRTQQSTLDIKGDIWQMTRLRHLQTNSSAQLPPPSSSKTKKNPFPNRNLQTLSRISPESCTAASLVKAPDLKNLGIQGNLVKLFETNKDTGSSLFKNLRELHLLEKLKLLNHGGELQCLPQKYEFPQKIRRLTLSGTQLKWSELSVLGSLEYLEILKLVENAFKGDKWEPSEGDFPRLQFLRIERTDLKTWKASSLHFPLLKRLILRQCLNLEEVPPSLADIDNLQEMELNLTNSNAALSAWNILQIKQGKEKEVKEKGGTPRRFKLSIYPPDELKLIQQI